MKANYELITAFLATLDWDEIYSNCISTEEYYRAFKDIVNTIVFKFVPFVPVTGNGKVPWFSCDLERMRQIKQRRWRRYNNNSNIVTYSIHGIRRQHKISEVKFWQLNVGMSREPFWVERVTQKTIVQVYQNANECKFPDLLYMDIPGFCSQY